jgi:hypothetical protein
MRTGLHLGGDILVKTRTNGRVFFGKLIDLASVFDSPTLDERGVVARGEIEV